MASSALDWDRFQNIVVPAQTMQSAAVHLVVGLAAIVRCLCGREQSMICLMIVADVCPVLLHQRRSAISAAEVQVYSECCTYERLRENRWAFIALRTGVAIDSCSCGTEVV